VSKPAKPTRPGSARKPKARTKPPGRAKSRAGKPARKPAPHARTAAKPAPARKRSAGDDHQLAELREELEAARGELARIASEENHWRRDLDARITAQSTVEERLSAELEAVRIDLRTALAELEIAHANERRADQRLGIATRELAEAREAERRAEHASDSALDELHRLRAEVARLRIPGKEPTA